MPTTDLHINSDIVNIVNGLNSAVEATDRLGNETKDYQQKSNQAFTSTETNIKEVNQAIKDQEKILKELNRESEKYAKRASKLSADEQKAWKRLQGDIKVAGQELDALKGKQAELANSANNVTSKIGDQFKKVAKVMAGAFTVAAIVSFSKQSLAAYQEQIRSEAKLRVALKGREDVIGRLIKQGDQLQRKTLFNDEEIINAQGLLAIYIKEEAQLKKLTPLILDFAQAKGMDLASAANIVGKTFGSSTNALTRYGIEVNGVAGSSQRFTDIMEGLTRTVQGQAEGALTDEERALREAAVATDEFRESWGQLVLSLSRTGLFGSLTETIDYLGWGLDKVQESGGRFKDWWNWFWQTGDFGSEVFEMERNAEKNADQIVENAKTLTQKAGGKTYGEMVNEWIDADAITAALPKEIESLDLLKAKLEELKKDQSAAPLDMFASFQPEIDALEAQIALYDKKGAAAKKATKETEKYLKTISDLEREQASLRLEQEIEADIRATDERAKSDEMNRKLREDYLDWEIAKDAAAYDEELRLQKEFNDKLEKVRLDLEKFTASHPIAAAMGFENEEQLDQVKDYVGQLVEFANELIDQQVQATQRIVDDQNTRIEEQQNLVNQEFQLKEEGLANNYRVEAESLKKMQIARDAAIKDREKAIRIQRTMSTIEAGVSLVTAAANIMKGFSGIPVVGVILGLAAVAAMIGGFIAAQSKVKEATQMRMGGRLLGPSHSEGGMRIEGSDVEVEGREWVVNARSSEKYNDVLTAINRDDRKGLQIAVNKHNLMKAFPVMSNVNIDDSKKLGEIVKLMKSGDGMFMGNGFYIEQRGTMRKTIRLN